MDKNQTEVYTANVLGGTGLVGSHLIQELIRDDQCKKIHLISRRSNEINHPKISEHLIDFTKEQDYLKHIAGDVLFSCLGTTISQAGSKENQYRVDHDYQLYAAKAAKQNGVKAYILISSPFAKINSDNHYRKMKAELEEAVKKLGFDRTGILQPNGLAGTRLGRRKWESIATAFFTPIFSFIPGLREYSPIHAKKVAEAALKLFIRIGEHAPPVIQLLKRREINRFLKE